MDLVYASQEKICIIIYVYFILYLRTNRCTFRSSEFTPFVILEYIFLLNLMCEAIGWFDFFFHLLNQMDTFMRLSFGLHSVRDLELVHSCITHLSKEIYFYGGSCPPYICAENFKPTEILQSWNMFRTYGILSSKYVSLVSLISAAWWVLVSKNEGMFSPLWEKRKRNSWRG